MAVAQQATSKNRRLAQQMANRPTVQAALKLKQRSLQQRLGTVPGGAGSSNIKSRLSLGRGGMGRGRGYQGAARSIDSRLGTPMRGRGRGRGLNRGALRGTFVAGRSRGSFRGRGRGRGRGMGASRGMGRGAPSLRMRGRGRGGRGRGARGRGGRGRGGAAPSREALDSQLETYMSKTKSHLDAELDSYMHEADPDL